MTLKRYLLFSGEHYYPSGGWSDFCGSFDTVEEAVRSVQDEWLHVIDRDTGKYAYSWDSNDRVPADFYLTSISDNRKDAMREIYRSVAAEGKCHESWLKLPERCESWTEIEWSSNFVSLKKTRLGESLNTVQ